MRGVASEFWKARAGASAVVFALTTPVLIAFAAMAIDLSTFYFQKRSLQSATDLAAIAAATNLNNATVAAQKTLELNGYAATTLQGVQLGTYVADPTLAVSQRFTTGGASTANAALVTTQVQAPYYFGAIFNLISAQAATPCAQPNCPASTNSVAITAAATAAINPQASFAVGSGLASLQGGVLNAILGGLLGANLSLSAMDYQSLANANVDLFAFSNALATNAGLTAVTYNQLASGQFQVGDVLNALSVAAQANPSISSATTSLLSNLAAVAPNTAISIAPLVSYGPYGALNVNSPEPISVSADALDLVSAVAQIANGAHQIQANLALDLPPLASATLALTVGERPVGTSFVAIGSTGATAHTAQTRLLLTLQIAQSGSTSLVNLPLYIELASATAQVSNIACGTNPAQNSVTLGVTPAIIDAWIGAVSAADMTNYVVAPNPGPATLLSLPEVTVTGRANATITNLSATPVTFSYADIQALTRNTTSTNDFISSLLYNLFASLQLNVNVLGLGVGLPSALDSTVASTLASATAPIDQTLSQIFTALGLSLGNAYTWVSGVKCGYAVVVN